ncbi:MAG: hypothetical protein V8T44_00520 [Odoribacter splanchnicus]
MEEEEGATGFSRSGSPPDYFQIPVVEALADDFTFDKWSVSISDPYVVLPIKSGLLQGLICKL